MTTAVTLMKHWYQTSATTYSPQTVTSWNGMQMVKVQAAHHFQAAAHCLSTSVNRLVNRKSPVASRQSAKQPIHNPTFIILIKSAIIFY